MRSHPYATPAPLPPVLHDLADDLSHILPNQRLPYATDPNNKTTTCPRTSYSSDNGVELRALDPETSRLLPVPSAARRRRHHVRVQGKLALVRSFSTVNLRAGPATGSASSLPKSAVGSVKTGVQKTTIGPVRRSSLDESARKEAHDGEAETESDEDVDVEEEKREVTRRDGQLRGYGIGGAGNIRRPTEVVQFRRDGPILSLPMLSPTNPNRKKWRLRELLGLAGDRKGKVSVSPSTP